MPTVTEDLELPGGVDPASVMVTVEPWGAGLPVTAFNQTTGKTIGGQRRPDIQTGATWSVVLDGNAALIPTGTVYRCLRTWPGAGRVLEDFISVPTTGGPYRVDQVLTTAPATIEDSALAAHKADKGAHLTHHNNQFGPFDSGMLAWSYDPIHIRSTKLATNGTLYLVKLWLRETSLAILNIFWAQSTPGAGPVANQNWAGLYSSTGALLGSSNVDAKVDDAAGLVEGNVGPLPNGVSVPSLPTFVRAAFLFNAATPPTLGCATTNLGFSNIGLEAFAPRYATGGTGLTALPANLGALTASPDALFASATAL